jgi:hypothetical protein
VENEEIIFVRISLIYTVHKLILKTKAPSKFYKQLLNFFPENKIFERKKNMLKLLQNPEMGRYYVAARNLKAGEMMFEELPFVIGPKPDSPPICLSCYCPVDGSTNGPKCTKCLWPLCPECNESGGSVWHKGECAVFVKSKNKFQCVEDSTTGCPQLDCITPLR